MAATEKISLTIGRDEIRRARLLASRRGLSLSSVVTDAVRDHVEAQARREAGEAVLATFGPQDRASADERRALLERWAVPIRPRKARRPRSKTRARTHPR
jgi:hypothetical protein